MHEARPWLPVGVESIQEPLPTASANRRKKAERLRRKVEIRPLNLIDVPRGSVLSEQTIADIQAGRYALQRAKPNPSQTRRPGAAANRFQRAADRARTLALRQSAGDV